MRNITWYQIWNRGALVKVTTDAYIASKTMAHYELFGGQPKLVKL